MNDNSHLVSFFHDLKLPESKMWLAGYAAIINTHNLKVPLPDKLAVISTKHRQYELENWRVYTPRHKPKATISSQLTFALKYEGVDLHILKALFAKLEKAELEQWLEAEPTGIYSRRIWFLYEWLTDEMLATPDAKSGNFIDVIDESLQYASTGPTSKRHRIRNNLPGNKEFCPLVRCTEKIDAFINKQLSVAIRQKTGSIHPDVLARAAAFLLLKDSRASFAIEGEQPGKDRAERWGRAIGQAGLYPLSIAELLRLQKIVIEDHRFVKLGMREEGGFIGVHDRLTGHPIPDHISAKWQDIPTLLDGMIGTYQQLKQSQLDPVIVAALMAFGLVFIHPFEDGNGRLHRYLIHHVLTELGFAAKGIVFPISAVILERLDEYRLILEAYSQPRLAFIEWQPTKKGNVEVTNESIDLYRYFDATKQVEFLYDCVLQTVEKILPEEINYLEKYDHLKQIINNKFDMPNYLADLLIQFLSQNNGSLSKRAQENEFAMLSAAECQFLQQAYQEVYSEAD